MRLKATYAFKAIGDDEPAEKGYTAEYVYLIEIDESGKKIVKFDEFLDPQRLLGYVFLGRRRAGISRMARRSRKGHRRQQAVEWRSQASGEDCIVDCDSET